MTRIELSADWYFHGAARVLDAARAARMMLEYCILNGLVVQRLGSNELN